MRLRTWERSTYLPVAFMSLLALSLVPSPASAHEDEADPPPVTVKQPATLPAAAATGPEATTVDDDKATAAEPALAPLTNGVNCSEMTDSFMRLYRGYFDRQPTSTELESAIVKSRSGAMTLLELSSNLLTSSEFAIDNGKLDNNEFINFVFDNTVSRQPTSTEASQWLASLEGGNERASMMLAFTESAEFIGLTKTTIPLAGYARWYPSGAHWYCGQGSARLAIKPLTGQRVSSDFIFVNSGVQPTEAELWVLESNYNRNVQMTAGAIPPMFSDYNWDGLFTGDGNYGNHIDVKASDNTRWIVVFYPTSIGDKRPGWEIALS